MPRRALARTGLLACLALLGACGDEGERAVAIEDDPAIAAALGDPLMSDPDLAGQDRSGDAVAITQSRIALPPGDEAAGRQRP